MTILEFLYARRVKESKTFLDRAFRRDFERNGPSLYRICQTTLEGWKRYKNYPDLRIRQRFQREALSLKTSYSGLLWAMERHTVFDGKVGGVQFREKAQPIERAKGVRDERLPDVVTRKLGAFQYQAPVALAPDECCQGRARRPATDDDNIVRIVGFP